MITTSVMKELIHSHVTYGTPCHARGHLTLIPREAQDFSRGDNHSKDVALPTYFA